MLGFDAYAKKQLYILYINKVAFLKDLIIKSMESCKTHTSRNDKNIVNIHARGDNWLNLPSSVGKMEREKK